MMGCRVFLLLATIAFLSSFGLEGQLVFAQNTTEQNQQSENTDNSNIIVDENGLTAVLPSDNVDVNLNNGLIAVVPGAILPTVQTIQTDVTETQPSGLIGVVPNPEQENLPTAEVSDVSISEVLTNNVQEAVTESVEVSEEIPEPVEQGEISFDEQVVEESSDVAYIDADVKQTPSNVIDYVQDAIQNTIYETPAPVIQQTIGIAENPENATTVVEPYSDTADVLLEESTNNEVVLEESESIQKVTITVAEKTEDAVPDTVFEVKTQTLADSTVSKIEALIPTDIEAVEAIFEYDNSFTAKNSFIGDLMRIPQPSPSPEEVTEGVAREVPNTTTSDVEPAVEIETSTEEIKEETVVDIVQETAEEIAEETAEEITEEVTKETPPEQTAPDLTTLAIGTQFMGELNLNDSTENVLATDLSEAVFHTYQIDVPQGQEVLTISVEGKSGDVDFAVKAGSEITSYTEVDYIDNSGSAIASYSYQFPPSGPVFIDVMNYTNEPVAYLLTTSDDYADAVSTSYDGFDGSREDLLAVRNNAGGNLAGPLETGEFFDLSLNSVLNREIAAKEPSATRVYHSYKVALPKALDNVEVALDGQGHDVDMAVRLGEPIVRLDEVDFIDNSSDSTATYQFKTVEDTVVYIDVMNHLSYWLLQRVLSLRLLPQRRKT